MSCTFKVNISKMVKGRATIIIFIKYEVAYRLSTKIIRFDLCHHKGQRDHWNGFVKYFGLLVHICSGVKHGRSLFSLCEYFYSFARLDHGSLNYRYFSRLLYVNADDLPPIIFMQFYDSFALPLGILFEFVGLPRLSLTSGELHTSFQVLNLVHLLKLHINV